MKKIIKNTVIICLLVSIYFFVISCNFDYDDKDYDNDFESGILGKNLNLSGQVYERMSEGGYEEWNFSNDVEIHSLLGGSGILNKNGQFSFNIGTPNQYDPHFIWGWVYDNMEELNNFKISPVSVQMALLNSLIVDFNSDSFTGSIEGIPQTSISDSTEDIYEYVYFIYVDQDVTVSADKTNYTEQIEIYELFGNGSFVINNNYTIDAFSHSLKEGWNAVYVRTIFEGNNTFKTFLHANPSDLKWTLEIITFPPFTS